MKKIRAFHDCRAHLHLLLLLTLSLGLVAPGIAAPASINVRVGVAQLAPDIYLKPDGRLGGIQGELLREIAKHEGWTITPHPCTWNECMALLQSGRIDLLPTTPTYYAARKGIDQRIPDGIDTYLERWKNTPGSPYFQILSRWGHAAHDDRDTSHFYWPTLLAILLALGAASLAWRERRQAHHIFARFQRTLTDLNQTRTNLAEQSKIHAQIRQIAFHDVVTGLASKPIIDARIEQAIASARLGETTAALLMLDIDKFKHFNEAYGRTGGDLLLKEVARRLVVNTRARDTVSRTNSDEFTILLTSLGPGIREAARQAIRIAEKLHSALTTTALTPPELPDESVSITVSGGVTLLHTSSRAVEASVHEASTALHQAQKLGGNCIVAYSDEVRREVNLRHALEHGFSRAQGVPEGFDLHLQPQFSHDGIVTGAELLARWQHAKLGPIPPDIFIPLAYETGLLDRLTESILARACEVLNDLRDLGESYPLSVNISPQTLAKPGFAASARRIIDEAQAPADRLIFEITEEIQIAAMPTVLRHMRELGDRGIRFSMDDFGTGYANLSYLRQLPLYEVKLDKCLIEGIPESADGVSIVRLSLALSRRLGLRVVAEGVERQAQADFLFKHRCDAIQGYLTAKPISVANWIKQRSALLEVLEHP